MLLARGCFFLDAPSFEAREANQVARELEKSRDHALRRRVMLVGHDFLIQGFDGSTLRSRRKPNKRGVLGERVSIPHRVTRVTRKVNV